MWQYQAVEGKIPVAGEQLDIIKYNKDIYLNVKLLKRTGLSEEFYMQQPLENHAFYMGNSAASKLEFLFKKRR